MEVLILQVFVSLILVLGSVVLFCHSANQKDYQHAGRLALLPLETDRDHASPSDPSSPPLPPESPEPRS